MRSLTRFIIAALITVPSLGLLSCATTKPSPPPTSSQPPRIAYKPLVTIRNNSYKNIVLGLRGPKTRFVSIPARSSRSLNLLSGNYKYAATAKNTNIISGYQYIGTDRKYSWTLRVN